MGVVAVLTLNKDAEEIAGTSAFLAFRERFVTDVAALLGVPRWRVSFISADPGSVVVTFELLPAAAGASTPTPGELYASLQTRLTQGSDGDGGQLTLAGSPAVALAPREEPLQVTSGTGAAAEDEEVRSAGSGWLGAIAAGDDTEQKYMVFFILGVPSLCIVCCCLNSLCCKKTGFEKWSTDKAAC